MRAIKNDSDVNQINQEKVTQKVYATNGPIYNDVMYKPFAIKTEIYFIMPKKKCLVNLGTRHEP